MGVALPRYRDYRTAAPSGEPYLGTLAETQYAQRDEAERYMVTHVSGSASYEIF